MPDGIRYRFLPLQLTERIVRPADILAYEPRIYRPLSEYGGWGIRYGRDGQAYNVEGNKGVQFTLKNGKRLLLGSARPEELASAVAMMLQEK